MNNSPIGLFDSGSGGLSVYQSIEALLPRESVVYLGDHAYLPYGDNTTDFIVKRVVRSIRFLLSKEVKLVVIACNTATVAGIDYFRTAFPQIPIVGVVPVIKTAAQESKTKHFVVLSTKFTSTSKYQKDLIKKWAPDCTVTTIGSSLLVPLIERGRVESPEIKQELEKIFRKTSNVPFDIVALGCTHYPFVRNTISAIVGDEVRILDSGAAVARQVQRILSKRNELSRLTRSTKEFLTTGDTETVTGTFRSLLGRKVNVTHVII
jgi:glutamate racemase